MVDEALATFFNFEVFWIYMLWGIYNQKPKIEFWNWMNEWNSISWTSTILLQFNYPS
jgi:hypothetical protein